MHYPDSFVSIRGKKLCLNELLDPRLYDKTYLLSLRDRVRAAQPFQHFVEDNWFNPALLELILEEFELDETTGWRSVVDKNQSTRRSIIGSSLGPASQLYFG